DRPLSTIRCPPCRAPKVTSRARLGVDGMLRSSFVAADLHQLLVVGLSVRDYFDPYLATLSTGSVDCRIQTKQWYLDLTMAYFPLTAEQYGCHNLMKPYCVVKPYC